MGLTQLWLSKRRKNDCSVCRSSDSWCNAHSRGAGNWPCRRPGRMDALAGQVVAADQFAPLPSSLRSGGRGQTGDCTPGKDTSDSRQGLCRNDKSYDCCCISGSETGMILP